MDFVSRKQLEIHHRYSFECKEHLKKLGCEWDPSARAWIAPDLETLEKCYEILEDPDYRGVTAKSYSSAWYDPEEFEQDTLNFLRGEDNSLASAPKDASSSIQYLPTKNECAKIVGEEDFKRYYRDEIPTEAQELLQSGRSDWNNIYNEYQERGWKGRSIKLLEEVVLHFRNEPPDLPRDIPANHLSILLDKNTTTIPSVIDGTINAVVDKNSGEVVSFSVSFPYNSLYVNTIKGITSRRAKWNPKTKCWIVPAGDAEILFKRFPDFRCSEKAQLIKDKFMANA